MVSMYKYEKQKQLQAPLIIMDIMTWKKSRDNRWKDRNKENWKFKQWWVMFAILKKDWDKFCPLTLSFQSQFLKVYKWDKLLVAPKICPYTHWT